MDKVFALITLLLCSYLLLRIIKPSGIVEAVLAFFCISSACIIAWGYALSALNHLSNLSFWGGIGAVSAAAIFLIALFLKVNLTSFHRRPALAIGAIKQEYAAALKNHPSYIKGILLLLTLTTLVIGVTNLLLAITLPPHEWDSLTYHLPRMAHYLQQNNLNYFEANYWAQIIHPKNSTLLLLYTFLTFGHNEKLMQLVQYFSYWVVAFGIYGITRKIGLDQIQAYFSALIGSLLIDSIMQATTTQNDLVIAAYFATTTYFLFAFRETRNWKYLLCSALGIGLACGTKASSFLIIPSILLIALAVTRADGKPAVWLRNLSIFGASVILAFFLFTVPAGYIENYRLFGNPAGSEDVSSMHSFTGKSISYILRGGTYNILRYGFDFLSLDGLPPITSVNQAQYVLRFIPQQILSALNVNLETAEATSFAPFKYDRLPQGKYWGIFGFGFLWIMVFLSLSRIIRHPDFFLLSLAAVFFSIIQAYSGPYNAAGGRYFTICAIFAAPLAGIFLKSKNRAIQVYLTAIVLAGCISALAATAQKIIFVSEINPGKVEYKSIFQMDRIEQITLGNPRYYQPVVVFEFLVPADAKVAAFLYPNTFEYPLFGKYLGRTIISINSFHKGLQPIPDDAQFLLYANGYPCALPSDKYLGADWFLRKLSTNNRDCPLSPAP